MKVAFDIKNLWLHGKGIGTFTLNLIKDIGACKDYRDVSVELYAPSFEIQALSQIATERLKKVTTSTFNKKSKIGKLAYDQVGLFYSLKKHNANLLFSPYFDIPLAWYKPLITTVHDLSIYERRKSYNTAFYIYYEMLLRKSIKRSSFIVTVSEYSKRKIAENFPFAEDKIRVIYNKVPHVFLKLHKTYDQENLAKIRSCYQIPDEFILYTGGIEARKNINLLIEGIHAARKEYKSIPPLIITGVTLKSLSERNKRLIDQHNVRVLNFLPYEQMFYLYKSASLVVNTSSYEGFGIPVLEALTLKIPMLCSDIPVYKEIGKNCVYYFENNNQVSFQNQLIKFFSGKMQSIGEDEMKKQAAFFNERNYSSVFFQMIKESIK